MLYKVSIIGAGNVAWHLAQALDSAGHTIVQVFAPKIADAKTLAHPYGADAIDNFLHLNDTIDVLLVCINDAAIEDFANQLPLQKALVLHTSGAMDIELLKNTSNYYGVFYPLQTLSKGKKVNFFDVPLCIEGNNSVAEGILMALAKTISNNVSYITSEQRKYLHLAAVFANNFTNVLYAQAAEILASQGLDFSLLRPLITETAAKIQHITPQQAQTGPAKRHDAITLAKHLEMLGKGTDEEKVYGLLTEVIQKMYPDKKP